MASDARAQRAREEHREAVLAGTHARQHRQERDRLIRALAADDWSYSQIAAAVGITPALVAKIVRPQRRG